MSGVGWSNCSLFAKLDLTRSLIYAALGAVGGPGRVEIEGGELGTPPLL